MKKYIISFILIVNLTLFSIASSTVSDVVVNADMAPGSDVIGLVLASAVGIYEVVARIVPTVKDVTLVSQIFGWLKSLSAFFNVQKK